MAFTLDLTADALVVTMTGLDRMWCLAREVRVPWSAVTAVRTLDRQQAVAELGWRTGGTYWPGKVAKGHYAVPGRTGARQFWCVGAEQAVLVVDTSLDRPARVVLGLPPARTADALAEILTRIS